MSMGLRRYLSAPTLFLAIGATAALAVEQGSEKSGVPDPPRVEIYTSKGCVYCGALRLYLGARDIAYVEHNINASRETQAAFNRMGGVGVPLVVIDGRTMVHGFDPVRLEAALDEVPQVTP